ncbi:MAG: hypothetical protein IKU86_08825 [Thermoguttaceae bacterium]|nr:hypothetical protein [Thermoguttaceae bacterium]
MKRTAKNEREWKNDGSELSRARRRSTTALALTCGACVVASGCQILGGSADERFRQARGEYAVVDESVVRDWENAAREAGEATGKTGNGRNDKDARNGESTLGDPASAPPVLRSAMFEGEKNERRSARKPFSSENLPSEPPKTFGERVKGLFTPSKKERKPSPPAPRSAKSARSSEKNSALGRGISNVFSFSKRDKEKFPVDPVAQYDESRFMPSFRTCERYYSPLVPNADAPARPTYSAQSASSLKLTRTDKSAKTGNLAERVAARGVSGRKLVYGSSAKRSTAGADAAFATSGREGSQNSATGWGKTRPIAVASNETKAAERAPVAPVGYLGTLRKLEDISRSAPSDCDQFFGWNADEERLLDAIPEASGKNSESLTAYSSAPSPSPSAFPTSAPVVEASESLTAYSPVSTTNLPASSSNFPSASALLAQNEDLTIEPNAAVSPGESIEKVASGVAETPVASTAEGANNLTAYSPSVQTDEPAAPTASSERSDFASRLGETGFDWFESAVSPARTQAEEASTVATLGDEVASTVVEPVPSVSNQAIETILPSSTVDLDAALANNFPPLAQIEQTAETLSVAPLELVEAVPQTVSTAESLPAAADVAAKNLANVAPIPEIGQDARNLAPVSIDLIATPAVVSTAENKPTAPTSVANLSGDAASETGTGETTQGLPSEVVADVPASLSDVATAFPSTATPVPNAETLYVEAPRALAAVENVVGEENGVAGPNFALAAPGLGAGEAIQEAVDERKNAAVAKPLSGDEIAWVGQIKGAIQALVAERDAKKAAGEDVRRLDARLRLLYLAIDEYDRSIQEIEDDADPLKVFWETERGELETLLQNRLEEVDPTFVAERLRAGLDSLSGLCDLQIRKSALVVAPACFGLYEERRDAFRPGETVFAYAELEYVSSRETEDGRLIDVECRWRLLNADGSELTPGETRRCSNLSETKLRDVVLNVSAPLPNDLEPGTYLLETEVVDMNRPDAKPATKRLELTVVAAETVEKAAE